MTSNEVEIEQSLTELKYLGLLKKIVVRFVIVLSNVYDFAKKNSGDFKTTIVSAENTVVSIFGPLYKNLKDLAEQTLVFVDDKFDNYAPSFAKKLATEFNSLIYEAKPIAKRIVTTTQAVTIPPITATILILQTNKYFIQSLTPLQNRPTTTTTETPPADTTKSPGPGTILQTVTGLANQIVGGLMGNVTQPLNTNPVDLPNQVANATNSLVSNNPLLGAVSSATQNIVGNTAATGTKVALQTAYEALKVTGVPIVAQLWYQVNKEHPTMAEFSEFILPVAESMSKLYNKVVEYMNGKDFIISGYLPLIPIDEMEVAYKLVKTSNDGLSAVGDVLTGGLSAAGNVVGGGLSVAGNVVGGVDKGLSAVGDVLGASTGLSAVGDALGATTGLSAIGDALGVDKGLSAVGDALGASTGLSAVEDALGASTGLSAVGDALEANTGLSAVGGLFGVDKSK